MSLMWQNKLHELKNYINNNPEIMVTKNKTVIPAEYKVRFYELFNETRKSFILDLFNEELDTSYQLAHSLNESIENLKTQLDLDEVNFPDGISWFVQDPSKGMAKILWEPLFDLIADDISMEKFENISKEKVKKIFDTSFYEMYEDWLEVSILEKLDARQFLRVLAPTIIGSFGHAQGYVMHLDVKPVIPPEESKVLSLRHRFDFNSFSVPDFIVYSKHFRKYVSVKARHHVARWIAHEPSQNREWLPLSELENVLGDGYLLVYMDDNPLNLALVNDVNVLCRPDMVIEFREKEGWYSADEIELIARRSELLQPKLGTFIVYRCPGENISNSQMGDGFTFLEAGIEKSRLQNIIRVLEESALKHISRPQ